MTSETFLARRRSSRHQINDLGEVEIGRRTPALTTGRFLIRFASQRFAFAYIAQCKQRPRPNSTSSLEKEAELHRDPVLRIASRRRLDFRRARYRFFFRAISLRVPSPCSWRLDRYACSSRDGSDHLASAHIADGPISREKLLVNPTLSPSLSGVSGR